VFRRIGRTFKEAFWGITHHFAMVSGAINAVMITLILVSLLTVIIFNISQITYNVQHGIQIFAKIDNEIAEEDIATLKKSVERIAGIKKVTYSDADDELDLFIQNSGEDGKIFEVYRNDNPLSRAFLIEIEDGYSLSQVSEQIAKLDGMNGVDFGGTTVEEFVNVLSSVRKVGYGIVIALAVLAIFLINSTIRITINSRKEEFGIMRLVGATNAYIRAPLVLEGIFIGILGSIIPVALTILGYQYVYTTLGGQIVSGIISLLPVFPFTLYVSLFVTVIGITVGLIGSMISTTRYLRWKRWK